MARRMGLGRGLETILPTNQLKTTSETTTEAAVETSNTSSKNTQKNPTKKTVKTAPKNTKKTTTKQSVKKKDTMPKTVENKEVAANNMNAETKQEETVLSVDGTPVTMVRIGKVEPNREQPRKDFDEDALNELSESIRNHGIIQPLIVRRVENRFEIVAGERRWRAARLAGLKEVPVIVKEYSDAECAEIALVENLQREDLNPIEEAVAFEKLLNEFSLTQEEVAFRVSKSRVAITNSLRLLKLPEKVRDMIAEGQISTGHGKVLLGLDSDEQICMVADAIVAENLSVRATEDRVKRVLNPIVPKEKKQLTGDVIYKDLENRLCSYVSTKVSIKRTDDNKGKIEISFNSVEDLTRILNSMGVKY